MTALEAAELYAAVVVASGALDEAGRIDAATRLHLAVLPLRQALHRILLPVAGDTTGWPAEGSGKTTLTEVD